MATQTGFLLSYIKFGDNDAVLHCFTRENGFQSFFAKAIYASKNKNRAYLLPMNELCFTLNPKNKSGTLENITKIDLVENPDFYTDIKANSIVFFAADFLNQTLRHENKQEKIYDEILKFLDELEKKNYRSHLIFLIKILKIQGLLPLLSKEKFLDPESGNFENIQHHSMFDEEISLVWKTLISHENPYEIPMKSSVRKNLLDSILVYYHYHYSDFRIPNSLEIVQQIFE